MNAQTRDTFDVIERLKAALDAPAMPAREAESGTRLLERLTRPVRVGVFGLSSGGDDWLLSQIVGAGTMPNGPEWPTLEISHGPRLQTHVTYEDGMTATIEGAADASILAQAPVFLRIEAPSAGLKRMSFLYLATDDTPEEQLHALDWAEPRTDIAIWATAQYDAAEADIWSRAPDGLKNHAMLVATTPGQNEAALTARAGFDFDGVFAVPRDGSDRASVDKLIKRLDSDISDARMADIDAAHMFLHRLGHLVPAAAAEQPVFSEGATAVFTPAPTKVEPVQPVPMAERPTASPETLAMLSEPLLYLRRRARALLEMLEWQATEEGGDDGDWAGEVLSHCCETTEGLQSRAMDWTDDDRQIETLRRTIDEACDVAVLLQVEGGTDQAEDAAALMMQLRGDFERKLAA